jgi:carboxyl-terminal processing protease
LDKFQAEQKHLEETAKKYKAIADYKNKLQFSSLVYEQEAMKTDVTLKEKRERWHESLSKDIYVEEALNILDDLQTKSNEKPLVNIKKKGKLVKN